MHLWSVIEQLEHAHLITLSLYNYMLCNLVQYCHVHLKPTKMTSSLCGSFTLHKLEMASNFWHYYCHLASTVVVLQTMLTGKNKSHVARTLIEAVYSHMQQLVDATQISASWVWVSSLPNMERECLSQGQVLINITWFVCMSSCYLHIVIHFTLLWSGGHATVSDTFLHCTRCLHY